MELVVILRDAAMGDESPADEPRLDKLVPQCEERLEREDVAVHVRVLLAPRAHELDGLAQREAALLLAPVEATAPDVLGADRAVEVGAAELRRKVGCGSALLARRDEVDDVALTLG